MNIQEAVDVLETHIGDPLKGLPDEEFNFISKITLIVNVDLLIKDENGRTLLSWRDDPYSGKGWHIPGGIVRFKEKFEDRVISVARTEIGVEIKFDPIPVTYNEIICKQTTRGHFISFLYKCYLSKDFIPQNHGRQKDEQGFLMWHSSCPDNLINVHEIYRKYI